MVTLWWGEDDRSGLGFAAIFRVWAATSDSIFATGFNDYVTVLSGTTQFCGDHSTNKEESWS